MRIKQSLSKILPFFCIVIAPMEVVSIVLYISFVSLFIVVQLSYFWTLLHQTVRNGFQVLVVPVYLSAYPFDGLFITMNVEYVVQPKSFFGTAFSPWADSSELQGIVRILVFGPPKLNVTSDGKAAYNALQSIFDVLKPKLLYLRLPSI